MVVDTGVFIEFLRKKDKTQTILYSLPENIKLAISSVTYYELLLGAIDVVKENDVRLLTEDLEILPFNEVVASKAGEIYHKLRKQNRMIGFRDIFIAATCIVNNLPILTLNKKHFNRIEGLEII